MRRFLLLCLLSISLAAESASPHSRYSAFIETPRASVSGILVLATGDDEVRGSLFNEFGITALTFTYRPSRHKVRLHSLMPMLDKWYVRRILRRDLRRLMETGLEEYTNQKYHIHYCFRPMPPEAANPPQDHDPEE